MEKEVGEDEGDEEDLDDENEGWNLDEDLSI